MIDNKLKYFVIQLLRRGTYRWSGRWMAEKRSKLPERNSYFCENPECGVIGGKKDFVMDHILPVVDPVKGFIGFDDYISRMFCSPEGFQRICKHCNKEKTDKENQTRTKVKREKKQKKKLDKDK